MAVCAVTNPTDCWAGSSPSIVIGDRASRAGTENGWNAPAGTGSTALGTREPAKPGSDTRARAVLITVPTTSNLGRTIGRERYAARRTCAKPHGAACATRPNAPEGQNDRQRMTTGSSPGLLSTMPTSVFDHAAIWIRLPSPP